MALYLKPQPKLGPEKLDTLEALGFLSSSYLPPLNGQLLCSPPHLPLLLAELCGSYRQTVIRWRAVWGRVSVGGELFHHQRCTVNLDGLRTHTQ